MTGMLLALFLYLLISHLRTSDRGLYACRGCSGLVHFDGETFVHGTGQSLATNHPAEYLDPLDPSSRLLTHRATPIGYPDERVA